MHNLFTLHPTLQADTCTIAELPLCSLLLSNDSNYPWTILVPRRPEITEIHQLTDVDQQQLLRESTQLSHCLEAVLIPDKLNIAAIGNMVPQLHIHHIARYRDDIAWPAPVWGFTQAQTYAPGEQQQLANKIRSWLASHTDLLPDSGPGYELAQLNIAAQLHPLDAPEMADFVNNIDRINALAEQAPGFVWRLQTEDGDATAIRHFGDNVVVNMSVWTDIESLHNYVYKSDHVSVLRRRREWFSTMKVYSVLWWVKSGSQPTIEDAAHRLQQLEQHGPHEHAFTFKTAWPMPVTQ
jgi:diadenosine tetraphosphate (Ap4A) HIT family hydrolase